MYKLLVLVSIFVLVVGFFMLSEATMGVGIIATAVLFAAWARIAQAAAYESKGGN
jgi:hypothetical protein